MTITTGSGGGYGSPSPTSTPSASPSAGGGYGSPTPSASPTASPHPTVSRSHHPSPHPTRSHTTVVVTPPSLPRTGVNSVALTAVGVSLLVIGAAMLWWALRRGRALSTGPDRGA